MIDLLDTFFSQVKLHPDLAAVEYQGVSTSSGGLNRISYDFHHYHKLFFALKIEELIL